MSLTSGNTESEIGSGHRLGKGKTLVLGRVGQHRGSLELCQCELVGHLTQHLRQRHPECATDRCEQLG